MPLHLTTSPVLFTSFVKLFLLSDHYRTFWNFPDDRVVYHCGVLGPTKYDMAPNEGGSPEEGIPSRAKPALLRSAAGDSNLARWFAR